MSLQERIFGLETEYAVNFYPTNPSLKPDPFLLVLALQEPIRRKYGIDGSDFLVNGGKFHHDIGHAEWAVPECSNAREVAMYDKAIDRIVAEVLPEAHLLLASAGFEGTLFVVKNNVDSTGNTYGCHENYLMLRDSDLLVDDEFRYYLTYCLTPFLITRQLFTGTGRIEPIQSIQGQISAEFSLSQRARFIESVVSQNTRKNRSIINFGREDEPLAHGNYRRLHLILGDSNLSGWATWMKLGTTAIILRMIEDTFIHNAPSLADPVDALHTVARDPTCNILLPLRNGRRYRAKDIQRHYFELAQAYLRQMDCSQEEDMIMNAWEKALDDIEKGPMRLRYGVDWVMKKRLLDTYLEQKDASWYKIREKTVYNELQARDLRYHTIGPQGLYNRLYYPDTLLKEEEIVRAKETPPPYTRARVRSTALKQARQHNTPAIVKFWMELSLADKTITLPDPLAFDRPFVPFDRSWWEQAITHSDPLLRVRAIQQLAWRQEAESLDLLINRVTQDKSVQVRRAAIEALGKRADRVATDTLHAYMDDDDPLIRWAVEEALVLVSRGVPALPPVVRSSEPAETNVLVQLLS